MTDISSTPPPTISPGKHALMVLGMHRSGTSAITGVLGRLGVQLGRSLYAPQAGVNEKGFWEHGDIVETNNDILRLLGSTWNDILPIAAERWQQPALDPQRRRLRYYLQRDFAQAPLWGLKDPRVCRLLPLWLPLLDEQAIQAKFLFVVRHPEEVVRSLAKRDQLSRDRSLMLWLVHNLEAEQLTRGRPRTVTLFEDLLATPAVTLEHIAQRLALRFPTPIPEAMPAIQTFLSGSMRHHRDLSMDTTTPLGALADQLHRTFAAARDGENDATQAAFDDAQRRWQELVNSFDPVLVEALRETLQVRGYYEKLFLDAYNSWSWKLSYPLRVVERWFDNP